MSKLLLEPANSLLSSVQSSLQRYHLIQSLGHHDWGKTFLAIDMEQPGQPYCVVQGWFLGQQREGLSQKLRQLYTLECSLNQRPDLRSYIAPMQGLIETKQVFYRVRDYIPGVSLASPCVPSHWSEPELLQILQETLVILAHFHRDGCIHGNLHPGNIVLHHLDGRVMITDFRGALILKSGFMPESASINWTTCPDSGGESAAPHPSPLCYVAPEQWQGLASPASDIYALGLLGMGLLTGLKPWQYTGSSALEGRLPQGGSLNPRLQEVLLQMVAIAPADRFASADEALQALSVLNSKLFYQTIPVAHQRVLPGTPSASKGVVRTTVLTNLHGVEVPQNSCPNQPADCYGSQGSGEERLDNPSLNAPAEDSDPPLAATALALTKKYPSISARLFLALILVVSGIYGGLRYSDSIQRLWFSNMFRLAQAKQHYQRGEFQAAVSLARTIHPNSLLYPKAQATITQWQQEWQYAQQLMVHLKAAQYQQAWDRMLELCAQLPETEFWLTQCLVLEQRAQSGLEQQGQKLFQQALTYASNRDFVKALATLQQVSPHASVYAQVAEKVKEYTRDRDIRANYYLQQAFNHAQIQDFDTALVYLNRIDPTTSSFSQAQQKQTDYSAQQRIRTQYFFSRAANRAVLQDYIGAILLLKHITPENPAFGEAQAQILIYGKKSRDLSAQSTAPEERQTSIWPVPAPKLPPDMPAFPRYAVSTVSLPSATTLNPEVCHLCDE